MDDFYERLAKVWKCSKEQAMLYVCSTVVEYYEEYGMPDHKEIHAIPDADHEMLVKKYMTNRLPVL